MGRPKPQYVDENPDDPRYKYDPNSKDAWTGAETGTVGAGIEIRKPVGYREGDSPYDRNEHNPSRRRNYDDFFRNYGKPMDQFLGKEYPGLEALLPSIQQAPGTEAAGRMSDIADGLEATQHQGVEALSNVAEGIDPAALSDPLRAREAEFRDEVAARAAGFDELARLAGSAPSVENARTGALLSQHAGQRRAALAGGRGLLGQRAALGQGATSGTALAADAAVRQGKEGVARSGEVAQNRLAGLNVYGQGHGISTGMLGTAGGLERDAFGARTDIFDAAADFGRGVASTRADLYGAAGDNVLDDQRRQGIRAAQLGSSILTDEASEDQAWKKVQAINEQERDNWWKFWADAGATVATAGVA